MNRFEVGQVLVVEGFKAPQRVLKILPGRDEIFSINIGVKGSSIVCHYFSEWHDLWMAGKISKIDEPIPVQEIPRTQASITRRDNRWAVISDIVAHPDVFNFATRTTLIKVSAEKNKLGIEAIKGWVSLYFQANFSKDALMGMRYKCGGKGKTRSSSAANSTVNESKKRGRKNSVAGALGVNVTDEIRDWIMSAMRKHYYKSAAVTKKHAYDLLILEHFSDALTIDENGDIVYVDHTRCITYSQMLYWYSIDRNAEEESREKYGDKQHNLTKRPLLHNSRDEAEAPGYRGQIDSTPNDLHLTARWSRHAYIGRAIIYFLVDVVSSLIGGYYITLTGPSTDAAARTLLNACEDKVELCAKYGISITRDEWPTMGIPLTLAADRGTDFMALMRKFTALGGHETPGPYRAEMRGIGERVNGSLSASQAQVPGHIPKDANKRGVADPRTQAVWNLQDLHKHVLLWIVEQNNRVIEDYPPNSRMVAAGIPPVPSKMWNWGMGTLLGQRMVPRELLESVLLEIARDIVIERGVVVFKGRKYQTAIDDTDDLLKTLLYDTKKGDISYDPDNLDVVLLHHPKIYGKFITCNLVARKNRDRRLSEADWDALIEEHAKLKAGEKGVAHSYRLNTKANAEKTTKDGLSEKHAEGKDPRSKKKKLEEMTPAREMEKQIEAAALPPNLIIQAQNDAHDGELPSNAMDFEIAESELVEEHKSPERYAKPLLRRNPNAID